MPIPLVNSIASWFLKKRFHQIELFLKYPNEVQNELLFNLLTLLKTLKLVSNMILLLLKIIKNLLNEFQLSSMKIIKMY